MWDYIATNEAALETSLGSTGLIELRDAVGRGEQAMETWSDAEPRLWGHLAGRIYRLLDVKGFSEHLMGALTGADAVAQTFFSEGIARWEAEGRLTTSEAASAQSPSFIGGGPDRAASSGGPSGPQCGAGHPYPGTAELGSLFLDTGLLVQGPVQTIAPQEHLTSAKTFQYPYSFSYGAGPRAGFRCCCLFGHPSIEEKASDPPHSK